MTISESVNELARRVGKHPVIVHHSWAADVKEIYDWLLQQDIIKLLWKKTSAFKHVRRLAVVQKYTSFFIKGDENRK